MGTENIFGDPAGSVYTKIGALDMSFQNTFGASVNGVWQHGFGNIMVAAHPTVGYHHYNEIYVDPAASKQINTMNYALTLRGTAQLGLRTHLALMLGIDHIAPTSCSLEINSDDVKPELAGLERVVRSNFDYLSGSCTSLLAGLDVTVAINTKYALRGKATWQRTAYVMSTHRNELDFSLGFLF